MMTCTPRDARCHADCTLQEVVARDREIYVLEAELERRRRLAKERQEDQSRKVCGSWGNVLSASMYTAGGAG